jgi:hypothetical protein
MRPTAPARARPNALVLPTLAASGLANLDVPLVRPETEYTPRINQLESLGEQAVHVRGVTVLPKLDVFNALNSDDYTAVVTSQFGAATYGQPSVILQGRIVRFGADVRW